MGEFIDQIRECAVGCGIATLIAAIITGGDTSFFIPCVKACLVAKIGNMANQIDLSIDNARTGESDWSNH